RLIGAGLSAGPCDGDTVSAQQRVREPSQARAPAPASLRSGTVSRAPWASLKPWNHHDFRSSPASLASSTDGHLSIPL
ncbi:MAG: hypothetical protein VYC42_06355, partial [Pseudomonadota bacterium]|nr:hypothetical protein [Pseudomonadota bacterium]